MDISFVIEQILLSHARVLAKAFGVEILVEILCDNSLYPHVDWEGIEAVEAEKQSTRRNLNAHALDFAENI